MTVVPFGQVASFPWPTGQDSNGNPAPLTAQNVMGSSSGSECATECTK